MVLMLSLRCPNDRYVNDEAICTAVVGMFGKIGVNVNLFAQTKSKHFKELKDNQGDFYMLGWGVPTLDSHYVFIIYMKVVLAGTKLTLVTLK
jgi:peptide/nickel transport system substrate-binding protein